MQIFPFSTKFQFFLLDFYVSTKHIKIQTFGSDKLLQKFKLHLDMGGKRNYEFMDFSGSADCVREETRETDEICFKKLNATKTLILNESLEKRGKVFQIFFNERFQDVGSFKYFFFLERID